MVIAKQIDNIWIPPNGRPYWINTGLPNAGPHLTDDELISRGLGAYLAYPFDGVWAKSIALIRKKYRG